MVCIYECYIGKWPYTCTVCMGLITSHTATDLAIREEPSKGKHVVWNAINRGRVITDCTHTAVTESQSDPNLTLEDPSKPPTAYTDPLRTVTPHRHLRDTNTGPNLHTWFLTS